MLIDNHKSVVVNLLGEGETLLRRLGDVENEEKVRIIHSEAIKKEAPAIMFYGLYNAGKSTLINALCRKNVAKVGDVPTTASIQTVPWEGYTLIDTPGINAQDKHTQIAMKEIEQSDLILFVMDNVDTFDREIVSQAMIDILRTGKALAGVVNQRNVDEDEAEQQIPVAEQKSMKRIIEKVADNLERQGIKSGIPNIRNQSNLLGFFPVNAQDAIFANEQIEDENAENYYQDSGVRSLANAIDRCLKRTGRVQMLMTPLLRLQETLRAAKENYQNAAVYGEYQNLADARERLLDSRQRLQELLLAKGLLKIEGAFERVKTAAMNGQQLNGEGERLQEELGQLITEATDQELTNWRIELKEFDLPASSLPVETGKNDGKTDKDDDEIGLIPLFNMQEMVKTAAMPMPIPPEFSILAIVISKVIKFFRDNEAKREAERRARENAERMAAYYKWVNELRDQEASAKASYEKTVREVLQQCYDGKLKAIDQKLAETNSSCAEHTENLEFLSALQLKVGEELAALSTAI